jgi:Flp pilus assembly protein TadD
MAAQFSGAENLTGRVTVLIKQDGVSVSVTGDLKIKEWEQLRLDCQTDNPVIPTTIITDGELVAYYMPNSIKPRIAHDPSEIGFPLITDLALAAFTQLYETHVGDLLGEKEYLGRKVYMVQVQPEASQNLLWGKAMFWVDAQSWLPLRVTNLDTPLFSVEFRATDWEEDTQGHLVNLTGEIIDRGADRVVMVFDLHRYDGGTWFPKKVSLWDNGLEITQKFSDLKFNVSLPDELFYVEEFEILRTSLAKGAAFLASRNWEAAVKEYEKVVAIDPYNIAAHSNLGYAYVGIGDEAGAIAEFEQVIMLAPDDPLGYNNLAFIYIDNGIYLDRALEMAKKAVELSPANGAFRDTLGWGYYQLGEYQKAVEELTTALELMGEGERPWDKALVHYHLGMAYAAQKRWTSAEEQFKKALDLDPSLDAAKEGLKQLEKQQRVES